MQGMETLTKKDLIDFVNEKFSDKRDNDPVATFFYCSYGYTAAVYFVQRASRKQIRRKL